MIADIAGVEKIARKTRRDFEAFAISEDELISAAVALKATTIISKLVYPKEKEIAQIEAGELRPVRNFFVDVPIIKRASSFPTGFCRYASLVLAHRLKESEVLGEKNTANIIEGGCGENMNALDPCSVYHNVHTFVEIGATVLGESTIVDLTADQFDLGLPSIYIGPLEEPWTKYPRLEEDSW